MVKKLILKNDFVIPKGTEFELIPGNAVRTYSEGNYEVNIATSKDTTMNIVINEDELECSDLFKVSE
ncbi:MAG: hypothetical protein ACFWT2_15650 [Thermoanaerobacterium thermosaccharolyticum]